MTTPAGLVPRNTIPGQVVTPDVSAVIDPKSAGVHALVTVLHHLIQYSGAYHSESDQLEALDALRAFEKSQVTSAVRASLNELKPLPAEVEDVTQRVPPGAVAPQPLIASGGIDYNKLAAAMIAAQAAAQQGVNDA